MATHPPTSTDEDVSADILGDIPKVGSGGRNANSQFMCLFKREMSQLRGRMSKNPKTLDQLTLSHVLFTTLRYANILHRLAPPKATAKKAAKDDDASTAALGSKVTDMTTLLECQGPPQEGDRCVLIMSSKDCRVAQVVRVDEEEKSVAVQFRDDADSTVDLGFDDVKAKIKIFPPAAEQEGNFHLKQVQQAYEAFKKAVDTAEATVKKEEIGDDLDFLPALRARAERHNAEIRRRKAQGSTIDFAYIQGLKDDLAVENLRRQGIEKVIAEADLDKKNTQKELNSLIKDLKERHFAADDAEASSKRARCRLLAERHGDLTLKLSLAEEELREVKSRITKVEKELGDADKDKKPQAGTAGGGGGGAAAGAKKGGAAGGKKRAGATTDGDGEVDIKPSLPKKTKKEA